MPSKLLIFTILSLVLLSCSTVRKEYDSFESYDYLKKLGIPEDSNPTDDYLISRPQYVMSFNCDRGIANWVFWENTKEDFGRASRKFQNFTIDTSLADNCDKISPKAYKSTKYDRGHIVPAQARSKSDDDMASTFFMTNITPQVKYLNVGVWKQLENECRRLCKKHNKRLLITSGTICQTFKKLRKSKVVIPDYLFKIIIILDRDQTISDIDKNTDIISVVIPNNSEQLIYRSYKRYYVPIDSIETLTGYDFFRRIPNKIENYLEKK